MSTTEWNGAVGYQTTNSGNYGGTTTLYRTCKIYIDASHSNSTYGRSSYVRPSSVKCAFYIKLSVEAGLPNLTGNGTYFSTWYTPSGLINWGNADRKHYSGDGTALGQGLWNFDASRANSIYGSSDTVTPLSCKTLFYIKA